MTEQAFGLIAPRPIRYRLVRPHRGRTAALIVVAIVAISGAAGLLAPRDYRYLLLPSLMMICVAAVYTAALWAQRGSVQVFVIVSLWIATTFSYVCISL